MHCTWKNEKHTRNTEGVLSELRRIFEERKDYPHDASYQIINIVDVWVKDQEERSMGTTKNYEKVTKNVLTGKMRN